MFSKVGLLPFLRLCNRARSYLFPPEKVKLSGFYKIDPIPKTQKTNWCGLVDTLLERPGPLERWKNSAFAAQLKRLLKKSLRMTGKVGTGWHLRAGIYGLVGTGWYVRAGTYGLVGTGFSPYINPQNHPAFRP
jgi:hypothetical protein